MPKRDRKLAEIAASGKKCQILSHFLFSGKRKETKNNMANSIEGQPNTDLEQEQTGFPETSSQDISGPNSSGYVTTPSQGAVGGRTSSPEVPVSQDPHAQSDIDVNNEEEGPNYGDGEVAGDGSQVTPAAGDGRRVIPVPRINHFINANRTSDGWYNRDVDLHSQNAGPEVCRTCLTRVASCVNLPCRHFGNCTDCAEVMRVCASCMGQIEGYDIFLDLARGQ